MDVPLHSIEVRPIRLDDADRLQASHARLSAETVYRRYLTHKPHLTPADTHYLVDIDGCDHFALVATGVGGDIVGVARFIRFDSDRASAEFAIVVADAYQRQGVATSLMRDLAEAAAQRGVKRFFATILSDNLGIRRLMAKVAAGPVREHRDGNASEVQFDLRAASGPALDAPPAMIAGCAGG